MTKVSELNPGCVWKFSMGRPSLDEVVAAVPVPDSYRNAMTTMLLLGVGIHPTEIARKIGVTRDAVSDLTDDGLFEWRNNTAFRRAYEAGVIELKG